jgi:hydrogenase-4 component E
MINILLITLIITLLYLGIANRLVTYIKILSFQGLILFAVVFLELTEINIINLLFLLLETIVFKAIAIPYFLNYTIKKNNISREAEPFLSNFLSLWIIIAIILGAFLLPNILPGGFFKNLHFVVAFASLFTGFYIIITRKKVITHVMGYLVIENGVFILTLAVGNEMPMLVNTGVLIDVFVSVLLLGMFINKIGDVFKEIDVDQLTQLKD